jgi:hypothetical protein
MFQASIEPIDQLSSVYRYEKLTPTAKNNVRPRDPKYANENGILSAEQICFRSACQMCSTSRVEGTYGLEDRGGLRNLA